jgi:hypothetical protein
LLEPFGHGQDEKKNLLNLNTQAEVSHFFGVVNGGQVLAGNQYVL